VLRCLIGAAAFVLVLVSCTGGTGSTLNPGAPAPGFSLPLLGGAGAVRSNGDFAGKVVLLNFWASWCGPCIAELPALERLYARLKDQGLVVVAIGIDDQEEALAEFQRRYGLTFPILIDTTGVVKGRYRLNGVPESFVLDRSGNLLLVPDPEDGMPTMRIIGPREWDSPDSISRLTEVLAAAE